MTYWFVGDEEPEDPRFREVPGGFGLYHLMGATCMSKIRYRPEAELPIAWFIPDHWIKAEPNGPRIAKGLVKVGLFTRLEGGYGFGWIRHQNTPDAIRATRKANRQKKARGRSEEGG